MIARNSRLTLVKSNAPDGANSSGAVADNTSTDSEQRDFVDYLFKRYRGPLSHYLMELLRSKEEAEEILQETYIRIIQTDSLDRLEARARGYLFKIATNLVPDRIRSRRARAVDQHISLGDINDIELISESAGPDSLTEWRQSLQKIKDCLMELQPRCRHVFILHVYEQLTLREIAGILHISSKTVERDLALALELCQTRLRD
jgi:RNA polymerase sigma-70 factor (ECF subfamily)